MKIPCDLILDLLPLYQNNLCSEGSEAIIAKHLAVCDECSAVFRKMGEVIDIPQCEVDAAAAKVLNIFHSQKN